ncbi:MAG: hypothetical protein ISR87_06300, partial [Candidatus Marinimicrobia bacterium]|nr:hypothetical protein [Candidatus Neomarinimicrobiota bacterium]
MWRKLLPILLILSVTVAFGQTGESCETAIAYGAVNDAAMSGDLVAGGADWYSFTTDGSFQEITVSLCGSTGLSDSK